MALAGENPLEFPGRSAVLGINTVGLAGVFAALFGVYALAVLAGRWLTGSQEGIVESLGRYVVAIVPIAFGYHFAHYLPAFIVDGQYAVRALSDPFALGWNLFGTADMHVHAALLTNHASVTLVYNLQVGGIVVVHVMAVVVAHFLALRRSGSPRQAILGQVPHDRADDRLHGLRTVAALLADHRLGADEVLSAIRHRCIVAKTRTVEGRIP